jgi:glycosyltransferase involved in cell wall biosynthesis
MLHVSHTGEGGVGKCIGDFVRDQLERDWRVVVATEPESRLAREVQSAGAELVGWSATRHPTPRFPLELVRLREIIRVAGPDVVHLHSSKAGLCGRLSVRKRIPTLFQPHGWSFEASTGALAPVVVAWERLGVRWADAIVCVSAAERQRAFAHGVDGPFRVVPNGVDVDRFPHADDTARRAARRRLGLEDGPLVVCVGRLQRAKGQDVLVESWPAVRARAADAKLALVGDGEDMAKLRGIADASIMLPGHRSDVVDWLAASDVVAVPSRWEGMSLGMLEAMATGRSIVITDVPGAREALSGTGAVVPPEDPEALAAAIVERLLDRSQRAREGEAAAHRARASYDLRDTVSAIAALAQEVGGASRRR